MKKVVFIFAILFALLSFNASASEMPDFPFVFADGEAKTEVPPDMAIVSFSVQEFNKDSAAALAVVKERSRELITFFAENKIAPKDIVAYQIDKWPVRKRGENYSELEISGYRVSRRVVVTLRDLKQYEKLYDKLLSLNNVGRISASFDRSDREKIEEELVAKACQNARDRAELMAKGSGVQLGNVFAISQLDFRSLTTHFAVSAEMRAEGRILSLSGEGVEATSTDKFVFVPSTITFENTVKVIFRLKEE
jgi:uncharacterized protein YggE